MILPSRLHPRHFCLFGFIYHLLGLIHPTLHGSKCSAPFLKYLFCYYVLVYKTPQLGRPMFAVSTTTTTTTATHVTTFSPQQEMSTSAQFTLVKPVPRRAQTRAVVNRPVSPHSPKQVSPRNGSVSAPDPHATRTARPARSTISKLTIVRVPQVKPDVVVEEKGGKLQRRQTTANGRVSGQRSASPSRISFASSSFSAPNSPTDVKRSLSNRPASPSRLSSANATFVPAHRESASKRNSGTMSSHCPFERLAPSQIRELAKSSTRPTTNVLPAGYAPSTLFMPLEEDVYLPFLDRPTEVLELLTRSDNKKLMVLFARMLPPPSATESDYPKTSCELAATVGSWTFEDLTTWLTQVSREEIEDEDWVRALRHFVLPKSEVLWERLKGMLGVPPELDVDPDFEGIEERSNTVPKDSSPLLITPIYPSSYSSGSRLGGISEIAEDLPTSGAASPTGEVVGLRISTSPSVPLTTASSLVKAAKTVPSSPRSRTPAQAYVPRVSSPLVPKSASISQPRPRSAPPQKNIVSTPAGLLPGLLSKIRSKDLACPLFPTSFDKLGMQPPTLLRI